MKIFARFIGVILVFASSASLAQESLTMDMVENDAIQYSNQKQIGRLAPFVSLGSYEFKSNGSNKGIEPNQRFGLGVMTVVSSAKRTVLEVGLAYQPMGARYEGRTSSGFKMTQLVDLEYLAVPLVAKTYFRPNNTGFFLKLGVVPAYLMKAEAEVTLKQSGFIGPNATAKGSVEDKFTDIDVQGMVGVGGLFETYFTNRIFLDLSFGRSLVPISRKTTVDVYNEGFLLSAGLTL